MGKDKTWTVKILANDWGIIKKITLTLTGERVHLFLNPIIPERQLQVWLEPLKGGVGVY